MRIRSAIHRLVRPGVNKLVVRSQPYEDLWSLFVELAQSQIDFAKPARGERDESLRRLVSLLRPSHVAGTMVRVGGQGDGGYVMMDRFDVDGAISIGVGPDASWDAEIGDRGIHVALFDPTVRRLPERVPNSTFFRVGICGHENSSRQYRTLPDLRVMGGFAHSMNLLLKMDVEGAEWLSLKAVSSEEIGRYSQIVLELHGLSGSVDPRTSADIFAALTLLQQTHTIVHLHGNNNGKIFRADSYYFPDVVEATYVRSADFASIGTASRIRSDLDVPCNSSAVEINLESVCLVPPAARTGKNC